MKRTLILGRAPLLVIVIFHEKLHRHGIPAQRSRMVRVSKSPEQFAKWSLPPAEVVVWVCKRMEKLANTKELDAAADQTGHVNSGHPSFVA